MVVDWIKAIFEAKINLWQLKLQCMTTRHWLESMTNLRPPQKILLTIPQDHQQKVRCSFAAHSKHISVLQSKVLFKVRDLHSNICPRVLWRNKRWKREGEWNEDFFLRLRAWSQVVFKVRNHFARHEWKMKFHLARIRTRDLNMDALDCSTVAVPLPAW